MAQTIHGELEIDFHKHGNWQDIADILLLNGYTLEISMVKKAVLPNDGKIRLLIMKECE